MLDVMLLCTTEANFKMIESVMIYFHSHLYSGVDWVCTIMNTVLTCCKREQFQLERCDATQILKTCLVWLLFFHCKHLLSFISWAVLGATKHLLGRVAGCPSTCPVCLPSLLLASISFQLEQLRGAGFKPRACKVSTPCFTALTDTLIWHATNS